MFDDALQEEPVEGESEELGVELMDTETPHLSLVLEESQVKEPLIPSFRLMYLSQE